MWAGIVLSAAFPFALGMALALLAIWALQAGKRWRFAALAALTLAASPLAFLLLVVVLAGVALARRDALRRNWVPVAGVARRGARRGRALADLPRRRAVPVLARRSSPPASRSASSCLALTWRVERARVLRFVFAVYLLAIVDARIIVPSAIGENIARLRYAAIPLVVLVFSLRRWRPRALGVAIVALAVAWNVSPLAWSLRARTAAT